MSVKSSLSSLRSFLRSRLPSGLAGTLSDEERPKREKPKKVKPVSLSLYFGVPGAGKSTFATWLAKKDMKRGRKVWSNFGITGAYKCEKADFGKFLMTDGRLIIDEAGLEFDNRKMSMTDSEIYFFKYHRHYQMDIDFFSQGLDVDIKIRKLARHIYLIKPSLLPWFICRKEIGRRVGISDVTKEIIDEYYFVPFGSKYIFAPAVWRMFNTLSRKPLETKDWETWYKKITLPTPGSSKQDLVAKPRQKWRGFCYVVP